MTQEWRPVAGYEGWYEAGSVGDIRSVDRFVTYVNGKHFHYKGKVLRPAPTPDGYRRVSLSKRNEARSFLVHRLIALAFIPNPMNKPEVNHKRGAADGDALDNLEWMTPSENVRHSIARVGFFRGMCGKFGANHHLSKPIIIGSTLYEGVRDAARKLGVAHSSITSAMKRGGLVCGMKARWP